jgi:hypothetical protein
MVVHASMYNSAASVNATMQDLSRLIKASHRARYCTIPLNDRQGVESPEAGLADNSADAEVIP